MKNENKGRAAIRALDAAEIELVAGGGILLSDGVVLGDGIMLRAGVLVGDRAPVIPGA